MDTPAYVLQGGLGVTVTLTSMTVFLILVLMETVM